MDGFYTRLNVAIPFSDRVTTAIRSNSILQSGLFMVLWLGVWILAYIVEFVHNASVWFPAAGLTFAGLLVVGARLIPVITICAILSTCWTNYLYDMGLPYIDMLVPGIAFAVTHITPYYIATTILKKLANHRVSELPSLVLMFLVLAIVSSLSAAFAIIWGLVFTGMMTPADVATAWLPFWVGDMAGIIAMAPLFVGLLCRFYPAPQFWVGELKEISLVNQSELFLFKLIATAVLATSVTLLAYNFPGLASHFAIFTLLLPIMWIAFSESPLRTALSVALLSFYIAFLVNMLSLMEFVLVYQLAICVIAASAFFYISIPSLMANNHSLRRRATTDNLTGIATRDYFMERSDQIITNASVKNADMCFVILDIDEFKLVNDKYGHALGDRVLLEVCRATKMQLRHTDIFGRFGGDEFVIMMPDTTLDLASIRVSRILETINHIVINDRVTISASAGIASMEVGDSLEQLFDRADSRLYRAKNSGRNKVIA